MKLIYKREPTAEERKNEKRVLTLAVLVFVCECPDGLSGRDICARFRGRYAKVVEALLPELLDVTLLKTSGEKLKITALGSEWRRVHAPEYNSRLAKM